MQLTVDLVKERKHVDSTVVQVMRMLQESAAKAAYNLDNELAKSVVDGFFEYKPIIRRNLCPLEDIFVHSLADTF